jgi:hypothetical protein
VGFKIIKGTFHIVGYSPDGDSIRFKARNLREFLGSLFRPMPSNRIATIPSLARRAFRELRSKRHETASQNAKESEEPQL